MSTLLKNTGFLNVETTIGNHREIRHMLILQELVGFTAYQSL